MLSYRETRVPGVRIRGNTVLKERRVRLRNAMTPAEIILWELLRNRRFGNLKFRRKHGIGCYIVDFYCDEHKLIVEVDGNIHELEEVRCNDSERQHALEDQGYTVVRVTNNEVFLDPDIVLNIIKNAIPLHLWRG